jgi:hypothetical protein
VPKENTIGVLTTTTLEGESEEESKEEYTNNEELDDIERYTTTYKVLDLI